MEIMYLGFNTIAINQIMTDGEIIQWKKKAGDTVIEGEILLEIASDKTNLEVESEYTGILNEILVLEGSMVPCGSVLAIVEI